MLGGVARWLCCCPPAVEPFGSDWDAAPRTPPRSPSPGEREPLLGHRPQNWPDNFDYVRPFRAGRVYVKTPPLTPPDSPTPEYRP